MGVFTHSVTAAVDPTVVWEHWTDVEHWVVDDPAITRARLNGPVAKGATGVVRRNGRRVSFRLALVDRQKVRFALESRFPMMVLRLDYALERPEERLDEGADGAEVGADADREVDPALRVLTHTVTTRGPLAKVWDRLLIKKFAADQPAVMANIIAAAAVEG